MFAQQKIFTYIDLRKFNNILESVKNKHKQIKKNMHRNDNKSS